MGVAPLCCGSARLAMGPVAEVEIQNPFRPQALRNLFEKEHKVKSLRMQDCFFRSPIGCSSLHGAPHRIEVGCGDMRLAEQGSEFVD